MAKQAEIVKPEVLPVVTTEAAKVVAPVVTPPAVVPPVVPPPVPPVAPAKPLFRRAKVRAPGTHVGEIDVEFAASAANPTLAAIEAAKAARGIVTFGAAPQVEFLD